MGRLSAAERRAMIIGRELVIHAADEQTARTAALLLHASYCLIEGGMFSLFPGMANRRTAPSSVAELKTFEFPKGPVNVEGVLLDRERGMLVSQTGFVIAAQIAALVSRHPVLEYCLFEYYLSTYLVTIDAGDLHPRWGLTHFAPSPLIID